MGAVEVVVVVVLVVLVVLLVTKTLFLAKRSTVGAKFARTE